MEHRLEWRMLVAANAQLDFAKRSALKFSVVNDLAYLVEGYEMVGRQLPRLTPEQPTTLSPPWSPRGALSTTSMRRAGSRH
jgi:hypothetical protein